MNIEHLIAKWEPPGSTLVRVIDIDEDCVERITRVGDRYTWLRFFELGGVVQVSVDYQNIDADTVICELAERV